MSDPGVCAVMLVNGRPEMTRRAIASFRAQTYAPKWLLLWDSSPGLVHDHEDEEGPIFHMPAPLPIAETIGALRNEANDFTGKGKADIIAHFDSDDLSHPRRLEEQVALLIASGKECVGYRELLFWDTRVAQIRIDPSKPGPGGRGCLGTVEKVGEAWLYSDGNPSTLIGASMCYWRRAWEACPFDDAPHEDRRWQLKNAAKCFGVSSMEEYQDGYPARPGLMTQITTPCEPRIICGIHGANTEVYDREKMQGDNQVWKRVPEWDRHCQGVMQL